MISPQREERKLIRGMDIELTRELDMVKVSAENILTSAEEGGQAAGRARQEDLAPVIARGQLQITTAGLVPAGQSRLWYHRSLRSTRPGAVMLDTSRSSPGSVAA